MAKKLPPRRICLTLSTDDGGYTEYGFILPAVEEARLKAGIGMIGVLEKRGKLPIDIDNIAISSEKQLRELKIKQLLLAKGTHRAHIISYDKEGQRHGTFQIHHANGVLAEERIYFHGKPEGVCSTYDTDGNLLQEDLYVCGLKLGEINPHASIQHIIDNQGHLQAEGKVNNDGQLSDLWHFPYETGDLKFAWFDANKRIASAATIEQLMANEDVLQTLIRTGAMNIGSLEETMRQINAPLEDIKTSFDPSETGFSQPLLSCEPQI